MKLEQQIDIVKNFGRQKSIVTSEELNLAGIDNRAISKLKELEILIQSTDQIYRPKNAFFGMHHTKITAAVIIPDGVICLGSALSYYGLTEIINSKVCLALPKGTPHPDTKDLPIEIVFMEEAEYASGIDTHIVEGIKMKIYNIPKTIADCFVYYGEVGEDIAFKSIKEALFYHRSTKAEIQEWAKHRNMESSMRIDFEDALKHPEKIELYT
jgi:predicted transcriptional regulator of viral defense system